MAPKSKTQKMSLGDFLGDQSLGSWADEMENMPIASESRTGYGSERRAFSTAGGYNMDRSYSDRGFDRFSGYQKEQLPLPTKPPFTAHLGNLPFDAAEDDIQAFFADCSVTNVRIVEDRIERKPKGFGYVEFATLDGLKKALDQGGSQFQGRNIRVSVAEPPKERAEARDLGDWTRKGPLPDAPGQRRASERGGGRNFDTQSDAGDRRRPPPFENDQKPRDFSNWERKGPLSPIPSAGPMREGGRLRGTDGPKDRRPSPAWGEGRSQEGSRPPRRDFSDRPVPERQPTASETDSQWRAKMRPDLPAKPSGAASETSAPSSPAMPPSAASAPAPAPTPAVRPKLNLQKRTVSETDPSAPAPTPSDSKPSPFGGARPIDTATKEKEIEEKRQAALSAKKEQEEKVREDKRVQEAAAKVKKAEAAAEATKKSANENETKKPVENQAESSATPPTSGRNYEILRRVTDDGEPTEEANDDPANGEITQDKDVKPAEVVRDLPAHGESKWRQNSSAQEESSGLTTDQMDEEGWSTVAKTKNNRRGGGGGGGGNVTRAIAS